ncbi:glycoside hydrolase family 43 protein [Sphingobacterium sp.]|uniref:glycoside hydrolase family 43 protein n=1 Tax=Sphingobacterium sp. TaxID=341027 RepID=UPI00289DB764|nr:glycoside hydrolase family 43 protein [Sphingobacterium sp.]
MNNIFLLFCSLYVCFFTLFPGKSIAQKKRVSAEIGGNHLNGIFQADPTIFFYDGYYYLYGTNGDHDEQLGFKVYQSKDLQHWKLAENGHSGFALRKEDSFGSSGFWAPQVWLENDKFYMAYTADENIAIAVSDSPVGPFTQTEKRPIIVDGKQIDPFVFTDDDGKKYLFHVRLRDGNRIFVAELQDDYSGIKQETLRECIHADLSWENTANAKWSVSEGPTVIRKGNHYYMLYSANDFRNQNYAVGVAIADNIYGPWTKLGDQPVLSQKDSGFAGTGHGDLFLMDNQFYYICHTHFSNEKVAPRRTAIVPVDFNKNNAGIFIPKFNSSKFRLLEIDEESAKTGSSYQIDVAFGDPFILFDQPTDQYYLYGTGGTQNGFIAYSSKDLLTWKKEGKVYDSKQANAWGVKDFWAPEVYRVNDKYYMYYSAHWKNNPQNHVENYRIGVAVADNPLGPFEDLNGKPIFDPGYPIIDANIFQDSDHRNYLFYSRCCYEHPVDSEIARWAKEKLGYKDIEESWVYGVELDKSMTKVIGKPVLLIRPPVAINDAQAEWESRSVTSGEINRRWTEGSYLMKENGIYYMMYSANYFAGANYAVGYATANSPLGNYRKSTANPIIEKNTHKGGVISGTGHNSLFKDRKGKLRCVYHGRTTKTGDERMVFISDVRFSDNNELEINTN